MRVKLGSVAAAVALSLVLAQPPSAAAAAQPQLKTEIDGFLKRLETVTHGFVKWDGADHMDIRQEGDAEIADIANARLAIVDPAQHKGSPTRITFDHIEIRDTPAADGAFKLSFTLPQQSTVETGSGEKLMLALKQATAEAVVEGKSGRARSINLAWAGARIEDKKSGDWIGAGPLSWSGQWVAAANGGWEAPGDFDLKKVEFFFTEGPVGGAIDRIAYTARSAGPDYAAMNRLRDRLDALREKEDLPPKERLDALLDALTSMPVLFSLAKGELSVEGVVVRAPTGAPFVALKSASMSGVLTGLSGDKAALRITLKHDGLSLAPDILPKDKVPQRVVLDFGLEEVATGPLRTILEAAKAYGEAANDAAKQQATQQMIGAAAMLTPVFRVYDLAVDTPDAGVDATLEAKGSPLSPKGYTAAGDVAVRGFDALPGLLAGAPLAQYLPLLKEIGTAAAADDGTPRLKFHLGSAPRKWLTVNGNDVTPWFLGTSGVPGELRDLRPAEKPMTGPDVRAVQRALADAGISVPHSGAYDGATAVAVARFQKANGLNVDGVVDAATRAKLGVKPEPDEAPGPKKGAN